MDVDCLTPETFFPKMLDCRKTMIFFSRPVKLWWKWVSWPPLSGVQRRNEASLNAEAGARLES